MSLQILDPNDKQKNPIRQLVTFSDRKFDVDSLPEDMRRVYEKLEEKNGEEYALLFVFVMRTAVELHRAWHMTLLTNKILHQIKHKFDLRMTWDLGVTKLIFRVNDGAYELHRKVPYDYDSEYQDIYMRIATALIDGEINVHEALIYQSETKKGIHTAKSGRFLRDFPGRLVLYPWEAATCAVIFFGGDWKDAGIAALTGLVAGLLEYLIVYLGGDVKILTDVIVGVSTGLIGGLFYRYTEDVCLRSIFLGTLYWFFYGTAFVIGLLEIIAGELSTGVTRFIAVSVKTFVLSLGAALGLMIATTSQASQAWMDSSAENCELIDLNSKWWRIPLYLLCSASALGQYRLPIVQYWRGLAVQLGAYEVQYQAFNYFDKLHAQDYLDTSVSNVFGAAAGVLTACLVSFIVNRIRGYYNAKLLQQDDDPTCVANCMFNSVACFVRGTHCIGLGRESDYRKLTFEKKLRQESIELKDPAHSRQEINLNKKEENLILETIVGAQDSNVWSILMPALYQLVPGSIIAKLWFDSIFPTNTELGSDVFSNLMVISTSLALGLILGFTIVQVVDLCFSKIPYAGKSTNARKLARSRLAGMYSAPANNDDDPVSLRSNAEVDRSGAGVAMKVGEGQDNNRKTHFPVSLEEHVHITGLKDESVELNELRDENKNTV
mmetsp:Transcript_14828/g.18086  ORF Transcript_14828/g.18086 Transcript_14828/m.18086 type:complete len:663 (-) Transcript_14828:177-2165(-)